jgi:hypothetical protein
MLVAGATSAEVLEVPPAAVGLSAEEDPPLREERRLSMKALSFSNFGSRMLISMQAWRQRWISVKAFVYTSAAICSDFV